MKIVTIIPAYNEEVAIETVVEGALKHSDVIVVDDGSRDNTYNLAKNAGATVIKHNQNKQEIPLNPQSSSLLRYPHSLSRHLDQMRVSLGGAGKGLERR